MAQRARWIVLFCCTVFTGPALASEPFPQVIRDEWKVGSFAVTGTGCLLCHSTDPGLPNNVLQKFGLTVKNDYEVTLRNTAALKSALRDMRADGTDSDGDGIADYDELVSGSNVNVVDMRPPASEPTPEPSEGGEGGASGEPVPQAGSSMGGTTAMPPSSAPTAPEFPVPETGCRVAPASSARATLAPCALIALSVMFGLGRRRRRRSQR